MRPALADVAVWLGLAAAPTFAGMAAATGLYEARAGTTFCGPTAGGSPVDGMVVMYRLMSAFHLRPWLRLTSGRPAASD